MYLSSFLRTLFYNLPPEKNMCTHKKKKKNSWSHLSPVNSQFSCQGILTKSGFSCWSSRNQKESLAAVTIGCFWRWLPVLRGRAEEIRRMRAARGQGDSGGNTPPKIVLVCSFWVTLESKLTWDPESNPTDDGKWRRRKYLKQVYWKKFATKMKI